MKLNYLICGLVLVFTAGACKKGGGDLEAFMALDSDKAVAFAAGGTDCEVKSKSIGEWRTKHTAHYNILRGKVNAEFGSKPPQDILDKYGAAMKANKKAVMDAMFACSKNPAFGKMMEETKAK